MSAEVFHPSEFILEELDERGATLDDLAMAMTGSFGMNRLCLDFYFLQEPGVLLGEDVAQDFGRIFGTSTEYWLNLDKMWQAGVDKLEQT